MNEREFIKLVRELHLLQLKVLGEEYLSIYIALGRTRPIAYVGFYLFIYDSETMSKNYIVRCYLVVLCVVMKQETIILLLIIEF